MNDDACAVALKVDGRFYCGVSKAGNVQTAWSLAGALLFGPWQVDQIREAEKLIEARRKKTPVRYCVVAVKGKA